MACTLIIANGLCTVLCMLLAYHRTAWFGWGVVYSLGLLLRRLFYVSLSKISVFGVDGLIISLWSIWNITWSCPSWWLMFGVNLILSSGLSQVRREVWVRKLALTVSVCVWLAYSSVRRSVCSVSAVSFTATMTLSVHLLSCSFILGARWIMAHFVLELLDLSSKIFVVLVQDLS